MHLSGKWLTVEHGIQAYGMEWDYGLVVLLGTVFMLAGIGFKLALPPFHQWAPDVYEGSPTPIAAFLSVGSKAAGLIVFAKIFINSLGGFMGREMQPNDWGVMVGALASLAMIIGNVGAIRQVNIKRMLAYSSIAQAGYIMIGMLAMNDMGMPSVSFYIFVYMFANMGAFAVATMFEDKTGLVQIDSYRGLSKSSPFMAASLSIFLLSLAGIPPLGGFLAKYYVFAAAIKQAGAGPEATWLYFVVGVGLLTSVFALFYYANLIKKMYFMPDESPYKLELANAGSIVVIIGLIGVFYCGLFPGTIIDFISKIPLFPNFMTAGM
jgi:NADH-quinone oxidoreductase subunit N